jgi:REP element-mobilizing transposase RayT
MARPLRLEFAGAVYHVMARGHERSSLFREEEDREKFLKLLESISQDEGWQVHAYCLMGNHYHLLIETPKAGLSRGMRSLNGRYTQWFNWRHIRRGHLFEGRFRSVLVQKDRHLLELCRYVVLNPVRARLVERAGDWRWSNYRATSGREHAPEWLEGDWTLSQFARSRSLARRAYRRFVAEGKGSGEQAERGPYLGDADFRRRVQAMLDGRKIGDDIPLRYRRTMEVEIERIKRVVAREWKVPQEALSRRRGGEEKKAAIYLARKLTRLTGREIGEAFGVKLARVSNVVTEIESRQDPRLARRLERLRRRFGENV